MAHNVTEIQQRLIDLKFLAPLKADGSPSADGRFGTDTLDAYNHFRASKGEPPHAGLLLLVEVSADVFPEDVPPPAPTPTIFDNPIVKLGLQLLLNQLFSGKGTTMDSTKPWYASQTIWANIVAVLGVVLSFFHVDFGAADQSTVITAAMQVVAGLAAAWGIISRIRATAKIG